MGECERQLSHLFSGRPEVEVLALFGSFATDRERPESDVDLYVRLRPGARWDLETRLALAAEASRICRREVDLVVEDEGTSVILRREVAVRGRPLFEAHRGAWADLRASAVLAYLDLEPYMRLTGAAIRAAVSRRG
jgi:predicted nucleotidyltransferase